MENSVSIIIPHYKTEVLIKLCLRSIRYRTKGNYEVLVVDNNSGDDPSLDYLRQVSWIKLIEHRPGADATPSDAHKQAMDKGIALAKFPFILSFHSDSIPIHDNWLLFLLKQMEKENLAAIGSYKLELKSPLQLFLKKIENAIKGKPVTQEHYIRSHCALYRRNLLQQLDLHFVAADTAGRNIHQGLEKAGHKVKILEAYQLLPYLVHLNHGTMVLRPELGARKKTIRKGKSRIERFFARADIQKIYGDDSLDH